MINSLGSFVKDNSFGNSNILSTHADNPIGINLEQSSGFKISDNTFYRCQTGISVYKSGTIGGFIDYETRGNTFERCNYGIVTMDTNTNLQLRCNNFNNTEPLEYLNRNWQIAGKFINQGNTGNHTQPAGNEFTPVDKKHVYSLSNFQYYRHKWGINGASDTAVIPHVANGSSNFNTQKIINTGYPKINTSCDDIIPPCNPDCSDLVIENENLINALFIQLSTTENNLDSGKTIELINDINSNLLNSSQLKSKLIQYSPLSEDVLSELMQQNQRLTQSHFVDVLEYNLPMSESLWFMLNNQMSNFNAAYKSKLRSLQEYNILSNTTEKTKREIDYKYSIRTHLINKSIKQKIHTDKDKTYDLMMNEGSDFQKVSIATMISNRENTKATTSINNVTNVEPEWLDFHLLYLNLLQNNKNWYAIDSIELQKVKSIANSNIAASMNAKAVLHLLNDDMPNRIVDTSYFNSNLYRGENSENYIEIIDDQLDVIIYPVPANDKLSIAYTSEVDLILEIQNLHSINIERYSLNKENTIFDLNLNNYFNGVYILKFTNTKNDNIEFKKFIKQ